MKTEEIMSDAVNPYQSPEAALNPVNPLTAQGILTEPMLICLKGASPWLRFIGILGFIGAGFTTLSGLSLFAILPMISRLWGEIPGFEAVFSGFWGAALSGTTAVFCVGGGALMFFPSLFIYRFGEKIRSYLRTGADADLELAFKNNKSLWKFAGIVSIIELAFIPIFIIAGIIIAVVMALN